jgi:hypothetical protein
MIIKVDERHFNYLERWFMSISKIVDQTIGFFSDAAAVIFSPVEDEHRPTVGFQPFTGEIDRKRRSH